MTSQLDSEVFGSTSRVAAFYGDLAKRDLIMLVAVSGRIADPDKELNDVFANMQSLSVKNVKDVDAGPLGGKAKCGDGDAGGVPLGMCAWTDNGSLGMVGFYFKDATAASKEFVKIRGEVEKR